MVGNDIDILSQLSQIEIDEREELSAAIDQMLEYFALMDQFSDEEIDARSDTNNVEQELMIDAEKRETVATNTDDYTEAAPEAESGFFVVPNVL